MKYPPIFHQYDLHRSEIFWRDHYVWLEKYGYTLRHRYHPDFVLPWETIKQLEDNGGSAYQLEVVISSKVEIVTFLVPLLSN